MLGRLAQITPSNIVYASHIHTYELSLKVRKEKSGWKSSLWPFDGIFLLGNETIAFRPLGRPFTPCQEKAGRLLRFFRCPAYVSCARILWPLLSQSRLWYKTIVTFALIFQSVRNDRSRRNLKMDQFHGRRTPSKGLKLDSNRVVTKKANVFDLRVGTTTTNNPVQFKV